MISFNSQTSDIDTIIILSYFICEESQFKGRSQAQNIWHHFFMKIGSAIVYMSLMNAHTFKVVVVHLHKLLTTVRSKGERQGKHNEASISKEI